MNGDCFGGNFIASVITEMGSVYTYLPDGRVQRFKKADNRLHEPADVLVFVPPIEEIDIDSLGVRTARTIRTYGSNLDRLIHTYIHTSDREIALEDQDFDTVHTNEEARGATDLMACFYSDSELVARIPVSAEPRLGYNTLDFFYKNREGEQRCHFGHKVVQINER